ncbi:hypothetical protein [Leptospira stimsonii]|uniref:Uncharacterized protein n=1 Tax=Leptospira stimsonii TaxID=2202203 RepID=A0ABY2N598_9LEPT|nr:hypothetical protein [Leptospira stimsonii]TGK10390.1 hypothetical protein EHO98_23045 [Leptospira stimsonii]TGM17266.1 hypothetical protein EHQ90_07750 [Leptospira stimsonii]
MKIDERIIVGKALRVDKAISSAREAMNELNQRYAELPDELHFVIPVDELSKFRVVSMTHESFSEKLIMKYSNIENRLLGEIKGHKVFK